MDFPLWDYVSYTTPDPIPDALMAEQEPCHLCAESRPNRGRCPEFAIRGEWVCEYHYQTWILTTATHEITCDSCGMHIDVDGERTAEEVIRSHASYHTLPHMVADHDRSIGRRGNDTTRCTLHDLLVEVTVPPKTGYVAVDFDTLDSVALEARHEE